MTIGLLIGLYFAVSLGFFMALVLMHANRRVVEINFDKDKGLLIVFLTLAALIWPICIAISCRFDNWLEQN